MKAASVYLAYNFRYNMNKNLPILGFVLGAIFPVAGFYILSLAWGHGMSLIEFWKQVHSDNKIFARVLTMSLLINLVPFLYYKTKRLEYTMNGVVVATILYAVYIVLLMYAWS